MTATFEEELRQRLLSDPSVKRRGSRLLRILDAPAGKRRGKQLKRMEQTVRVATGFEGKDWGKFDWAAFFEMVLKLLLALLPILLAL